MGLRQWAQGDFPFAASLSDTAPPARTSPTAAFPSSPGLSSAAAAALTNAVITENTNTLISFFRVNMVHLSAFRDAQLMHL
jgi:hypothetical protein